MPEQRPGRKIAITYIFDFDRDRPAYLNFPNYLRQMGCPPDVVKQFVQHGRGNWASQDGQVQITKTVERVNAG